MRRLSELRRLDPVDVSQVEAITSRPVFDELRRATIALDRGEPTAHVVGSCTVRRLPRRRTLAVAAVASAALVAGLVVTAIVPGNAGTSRPRTTAWRSGRVFSVGPASHKAGTWRLVDDVLTGTWQQNTSGPPPGYLDCPAPSACYTMSGHYPNANAGAPLLGEFLYVSTDAGSTWTVFPMPRGFAPTSPLSCPDATTCAAGGTYKGQPVLVVTTDGGHSFTIDRLPSGIGNVYALSCPATGTCGALVASRGDGNNTPLDATFLETTNGGASFTDHLVASGYSMTALDCTSALDCTAVGNSDALGTSDWTAGVAGVTTDGGASWTVGPLPAGFGVNYLSQLSCADAEHCALTGWVAATVANPPQCAKLPPVTLPPGTPAGAPTTTTPPSPAVRAISASESAVASAQAREEANAKTVTCSSSTQTLLGDIATTTDGGRTWTPEPMPTNVPAPQFSGLSCPTAEECWASGSEGVPEQVGTGTNDSSPVLLGTTNGGATWSKVTFSVPEGAPDYDGQSYLDIGAISCATADVCAGLGAAAQGSPSTPVYSLVVPPSE